MRFIVFKNTVLLFVLVLISCGNVLKTEDGRRKTEDGRQKTEKGTKNQEPNTKLQEPQILIGANQTDAYLTLLKGKRVGVVANQTSVIFKEESDKLNVKSGYAHLIDSLVALNIVIKKNLEKDYFPGLHLYCRSFQRKYKENNESSRKL